MPKPAKKENETWVPVQSKGALGDTYFQMCSPNAHWFEGHYGTHESCPQCGHVEYFSFPGPMSRSRFAAECSGLGAAAVKRMFGVNIEEYDRYDFKAGDVSPEIARKMTSLRSRPTMLRVRTSSATNSNTKFGVRTPKGDFPTVNAAAEAHEINYPTAYVRAVRGTMGWSKIALVAGRLP